MTDQQVEALRIKFQSQLQTLTQQYMDELVSLTPNAAAVVYAEVSAFAGDLMWRIADATRNVGLDQTGFSSFEDLEQYLLGTLMARAEQVFEQLETNDNVMHVDESDVPFLGRNTH